MQRRLRRWLYPDPEPPEVIYTRYSEIVNRPSMVLDLGCGRGAAYQPPTRRARIIGADPNMELRENNHVDCRVRTLGEQLPFAADQFDACVLRSVVEHLDDPPRVFAEVARVLRSGATLFITTPNLLHVAYWFSALIPNNWHPWIVRRVTGREERDTFPTRYRANTAWRLRRLLGAVGFGQISVLFHQRGPGYLAFSWPTFLLGAMQDKLAARYPRVLGWSRQWLIVEAIKG